MRETEEQDNGDRLYRDSDRLYRGRLIYAISTLLFSYGTVAGAIFASREDNNESRNYSITATALSGAGFFASAFNYIRITNQANDQRIDNNRLQNYLTTITALSSSSFFISAFNYIRSTNQANDQRASPTLSNDQRTSSTVSAEFVIINAQPLNATTSPRRTQ